MPSDFARTSNSADIDGLEATASLWQLEVIDERDYYLLGGLRKRRANTVQRERPFKLRTKRAINWRVTGALEIGVPVAGAWLGLVGCRVSR